MCAWITVNTTCMQSSHTVPHSRTNYLSNDKQLLKWTTVYAATFHVCVCVHWCFVVTAKHEAVQYKLYILWWIACMSCVRRQDADRHSRERLEHMSSLSPGYLWQQGCDSDEHCQLHPSESPHLREREGGRERERERREWCNRVLLWSRAKNLVSNMTQTVW